METVSPADGTPMFIAKWLETNSEKFKSALPGAFLFMNIYGMKRVIYLLSLAFSVNKHLSFSWRTYIDLK